MATWDELRQHIETHYRTGEEDGPDWCTFVLGTSPGRLQQVFVTYRTMVSGTEPWVVIESPFGELVRLDLAKVLLRIQDEVCDGLGLFQGELVTVRHAVPLENLQLNEFERPLFLVTNLADQLEEEFLGGDRF